MLRTTMAPRQCYYLLVIICPYLLMILVFYREIEHAESNRKASIENSNQYKIMIPFNEALDRKNWHSFTNLNSTNQLKVEQFRNVLKDKHVNKNPRSSFQKPELAKLKVQVKGIVRTEDSDILKRARPVSRKNSIHRWKQREYTGAIEVVKRKSHGINKRKTTTTSVARYQVPKPVIKTSCLNINSKGEESYGFQNISGFYVFSAFYDNRDKNAVVRLIVLKQRTDQRKILCGFGKRSHLYIIQATQYEMCENHSKKYGGWILTCSVPPQIKTIPCHVYLSSSVAGFRKRNQGSAIKINITTATTGPDKYKNDFGVCVPPLFDDISVTSLVQFIELSKILGASHFTFYHTQTSQADIDGALTYYKRKGEVSVIPWLLPGKITEKVLWYYGQILAIQDCLYRNMASFRYLIFNDLDEFIVPKNLTTWSEMVEELFLDSQKLNATRNNYISGFSFQSAFFSPNQPIDSTYKVRFLQFLYRTQTLSTIRSKLMVKPENIFELGIHHISRPISEHFTSVAANPNIGFIHHYRTCSIDYDTHMKCEPVVEDLTMWKYGALLQSNYLHAMDEIISVIYGMR